MIPTSIAVLDKIVIQVEQIELTNPDLLTISATFSHPSVIKYLKHLKNDLYQDHAQIDLKTYYENKELYALQQVFVKGGINVIETLLQIHKNQSTPQSPQGVTNATGTATRNIR